MQLKTTITKKEFMKNLNNSIINENKELINTIIENAKNKFFNNENEKMQYILKELDFFNFISIDSIPLLVISIYCNSIRFYLFCKSEYDSKKKFYDDIILKHTNNDDLIEDNAIFTNSKGYFSDILCECFEDDGIIGFNFYHGYGNEAITISNSIIENEYNYISSYQFYTLCFLFNHIYKDFNNISTDVDNYKYFTIVHNYKLYKNNANSKVKFVNNNLYNNNVSHDFLYHCDDYSYTKIELNINSINSDIRLDDIISNNLYIDNFKVTMENKK